MLTTKLYGNIFSYNRNEDASIYDNLSFALEFKTKSNQIHEFEILKLSFVDLHSKSVIYRHENNDSQISAGQENLTFNFAFKYKYKTVSFIENNNFSFFLYTSQLSYYSKINNRPLISTAYHTKNAILFTAFSVIPAISYNYGNLIYIDLNIPVDILSFGVKRSQIDNPALPEDLRTGTSFYVNNFFPFKLYVKLGIGFKIYEKRTKRYRNVLYL